MVSMVSTPVFQEKITFKILCIPEQHTEVFKA